MTWKSGHAGEHDRWNISNNFIFPKFQLNAFWNSYIPQQFCDNRSLFFLPHTLKILIGFNCLQDIFNFFNR